MGSGVSAAPKRSKELDSGFQRQTSPASELFRQTTMASEDRDTPSIAAAVDGGSSSPEKEGTEPESPSKSVKIARLPILKTEDSPDEKSSDRSTTDTASQKDGGLKVPFERQATTTSQTSSQAESSISELDSASAFPGRGLAEGTRDWEIRLRRAHSENKEEIEAAVAGKLAPGTRNWETTLRKAKLKEKEVASPKKFPDVAIKRPIVPMTPKSVMTCTTSMSKKSFGTLASEVSEEWYSLGETLILLDWDDTLCPTSSCSDLLERESLSDSDVESLRKHEDAIIEFLKVARNSGHVTIVTMAMEAWITEWTTKLLPRLPTVLKSLNIEVVSARETLSQRLRRSAFGDGRDPSQYMKMNAMERIIKQFYKAGGRFSTATGTCRARSWKNIISVGDSSAERLAVQDLVFRKMQRSRRGVWQECRCKTMLLLANPGLEEITKELQLMKAVLPPLARHDGDMHVDFTEKDLEIPLDNHH